MMDRLHALLRLDLPALSASACPQAIYVPLDRDVVIVDVECANHSALRYRRR